MRVDKVVQNGREYYRLRDKDGKYIKKLGKSRDEYDAFVDDARELAGILQTEPHLLLEANLKRLINEAKRQKERLEDKANVAGVQPIPVGPFSAISIDPPWDWGDEGDVDQLGRAKPTYITMPFPEIKNLPIISRSKPDCHLYLWITNRSLPKGFELLEAWGFRFITLLTWGKPHFGMGNYFRGQTEHIMFGVKGSLPILRHDIGTLFQFNRGNNHSSKPDEIFGLLATCSPEPRLEMFARKEHEGWMPWGNLEDD
jgi:N6-adenosine-specific RNA methylase IME4